MLLTGGDHTPLVLRHRIGDSDRGLPVTVVVDARQGWVDRDLLKLSCIYEYLTFVERQLSKCTRGCFGSCDLQGLRSWRLCMDDAGEQTSGRWFLAACAGSKDGDCEEVLRFALY